MKKSLEITDVAAIDMAGSCIASVRTACVVWGIASITTLIAVILALGDNAVEPITLNMFATGFIVAVGCIKAALILRYYLGLGPAAGSWRAMFIAFLIVIFLGVLAAQGVVILMTPQAAS
ncbi:MULTISPECIES: cytochrome C oxidase subunit IV family protein [Thalassospira]|uniref:Cytochrome C oxidase subunit IV n=2 Tax=Thalassospira TaxID=168934 RepID=A0A367W808_9PROT|nr:MULTISPECIES: cytochrome C oxidase subunit IV family protein [Thalassospira]MDG4720442.1 cytochrome C oxidase subunit IV family protein [Thalassospira sp. FZY0004]RCK37578.1 hypothetical protein TH19_10025 [Thalassospira profundimaris]